MLLLDTSFWTIKDTERKGRGIFAAKEITAGTVIGDYIGVVKRTVEVDVDEENVGLYLMYYSDTTSLYPEDITAIGMHLINHSCTPNTGMTPYQGHTLYFALRRIFPGEELTVSYMIGPNPHCNPCLHPCTCASTHCRGTIHAPEKKFQTWSAFWEERSLQTPKARVHYNKILPKLSEYPEKIEDHPIYDLYGADNQSSILWENNEDLEIRTVRQLIRSTGKKVSLPATQTTIRGVQDQKILLS